jgi:aminoglycoside phosphotransferase family enzyme
MVDQKQVVEALMDPRSYDEEAGSIEMIQTHISYVFLIKDFVYKVKKAVNLGFLDFTTLEKRRFFCQKELELNRRLCKGMYLDVVPINRSNSIRIKGNGETVEYAVKMKRMPQEMIMSNLLEKSKIDGKVIDRIAKIIAEFHSKAKTSKKISEYGSMVMLETNWKENFEQTEEFIGNVISAGDFDLIRKRVTNFMERKVCIFENRRAEDRIRDCHGDIHSGNIFIINGVYIFDAIEFNERFRYSDVAADMAFLAMDLDFRKRYDLSDFFTERYIKYSGDQELTKLLLFYKCYRAYVRGKVVSFKLADINVRSEEKMMASKEAKAYFKLALNYAKRL